LLEVGRIGRAHGLHGEVSVVAISNRPERFDVGSTLFVDGHPLVIAAARRHQDRWLVHFEGVDDRTAAEALRNKVLMAEPLDTERGEDELWVHELIGAEVHDRAGVARGRVVAVEANPAHDLLVLDDGRLVPVVFIVSHEPGLVGIDPPEGRFEL
jgi:16S rRNA processing protein RimM